MSTVMTSSPVPAFNPALVLRDQQPGPWGAAVPISYDPRDVLLYAVGIGCQDLRYVYEGHPGFAVFPTFGIRWGSTGLTLDHNAVPFAPGPLLIDAERTIEQLAPLPLAGTVMVRSRLLAVHPRGKGAAFSEYETEVHTQDGLLCLRMMTGFLQRGLVQLGDIAPFVGCGVSRSQRTQLPERAPDLTLHAPIAANQAQLYRLSGDYNPLHVDPVAAQHGGFEAPILHGLCTYGLCAQLLLGALCDGDPQRFGTLRARFSAPVLPGDVLHVVAWHDGPGRVLFEARVGDRAVVSHASFDYR